MTGRAKAPEVSVWLRPGRTAKEAPPLSRAGIVAAAVAILDEDGIEKLSMRRLAERLGVMAPSLYWHVSTKDDVVDLAVDAIFGEVAAVGDGEWREAVTAVLKAWRESLLRHPWAAAVSARRRPTLGPNFLAQLELLQSTLARAGFNGESLHAATWALYNHVMGSVSSQAALRITDAERRLGQERLQQEADRYPTLARERYLYDDDWDGAFATGLRYLLDGLTAAIDTGRNTTNRR